ncbi:MAG: hypothetical protein PF692_15290 [Kiritimatiellae bacterium]|jgi:hypothetical protein|nr:hypothetical protein [Kiritimatiellia bacterium]
MIKNIIQDILSFFRSHWPHLIIAIPVAITLTIVHELAHCSAVWAQGGNVTDFVWLPSGSEWGHMKYSFPKGVEYSRTAISFAPYAFWIFSCLFAGILSLKKSPWPFWFASIIFVWLFIVPLADIANAAIPYIFWNTKNDFKQAFGSISPSFVFIATLLGLTTLIYGFFLNKRLYRNRSLGFPAYCILATTATLIIFIITS